MYGRKMEKKHKAMIQNEAVWALGFECLNSRADKELYSHRIKTIMHIVISRDFKHLTAINHALKWSSHLRKHTEKVAASSSLQLQFMKTADTRRMEEVDSTIHPGPELSHLQIGWFVQEYPYQRSWLTKVKARLEVQSVNGVK